MNNQNLLIIDSRITDISEIILSIKNNNSYIILDYYTDSFDSLIYKIECLNQVVFNSIGLIRHGYYLSTYKLIDSQTIPSIVYNINTNDPELDSWKEIYNFISYLKYRFQINNFDFISCRLDKYPDFNYIFSNLENITQVNIRASSDDIGNLTNWILETDNVNIVDIYFNDNIFNYPYLFFQPILIIKADSFIKSYDRILFTNTNVSYDGFIDNDSSSTLSGTLSYSGTYLNAINIGNYSIIPSGLTSIKYYIDYQQGTLSITPGNLTISINNYIKIYNNNSDFPNYIINYSGLASNPDNTLSGSLTLSGNFITAVNIGTYNIIPSGINSINYYIDFEPSTLTINKAPLLVIANNFSKIYDRIPYYGGNGITYVGFVGTDDDSCIQGTLIYSGDSQGSTQSGVYSIIPSGLFADNYNITFIPGTLNIYIESFLIKANDFAKFYDRLFFSNPTIAYTGDINDLSGNLSFSGSYSTALNSNSDNVNNNPYIIQASGLYSSNYVVSYFDGTLIIEKAEVNVIGNDYVKTYDSLPFHDMTVRFEGLYGTDNSSNFTGTPVNLGTSEGAINFGIYNIIPSNLYSNNYNILYKQGTLTINRAPLIINARSFTKIYDTTTDIDNDIMQSNIIYSISGMINNEKITIISYSVRYQRPDIGFQFIDISFITISGFTADNYYVVSPPPIVGTILPKSVVATFSDGNKNYDGTTDVYSLAYSLSGILGLEYVTISSYYAKFRNFKVGTQIIDISYVVLGGITAHNYYVEPVLPISALIYQNFLRIYWYGGDKTYDSFIDAGPLTFSISGVLEGEFLTISSFFGTFRDANVGRHLVDVSSIVLWGPTAYTYTLPKHIPFYANIYHRYVDATFSGGDKIYDATKKTGLLSVSLSNVIGNEYITISDYYSNFQSTNVGLNYLDISFVRLFGSTSHNYRINPIQSIKSYIYPKELVATFSGGNKIYDGTTYPSFVFSNISGVVEAEFTYTKDISAILISPYYNVILYDLSSIPFDNSNNNLWYVDPFYYTFEYYIDASGNIDPSGNGFYIVNVDLSKNSIDINAKWMYKPYDISNVYYQRLYNNNTLDFIYATLYINSTQYTNVYFNGILYGSHNNYNMTNKYPILINPGTNIMSIDTHGLSLLTVINNLNNEILFNSNDTWTYTTSGNIIQYNYYSYESIIENVTISTFVPFYQTEKAGFNLIDISNIVLQGPRAFNYIVKPIEPFNATISRRELVATFIGGDKIYDSTDYTGPIYWSLSGIVNYSLNNIYYDYLENVTISTFVSRFKDVNKGFQLIDISNIRLTDPTGYNYYIRDVPPISAFIEFKDLIATFIGGDKPYDSTFVPGPILSSLSGIIGMEDVTISRYIAIYNKNTYGLNLIDISNISLQGPTSHNYRILSVAAINGFIDYKDLVATFIGGDKIYDSTVVPGPILSSISGIIGMENVTISRYIAVYQKNTAGLNLIDISNIVLQGPTQSNYRILPVAAINGFIDYKRLVATFTQGSKTYDSFRFANVVGTLSGIIGTEDVKIDYYMSMFRDQNVGLQFIDISNITLSGPTSTNYIVEPIKSISGIIYHKALVATFIGGNKIYDSTFVPGPIINSLSGIIGMEDVTISRYIAVYKRNTYGLNLIDISNMTLQGPTSHNYYILPVPAINGFIEYKDLIATFIGGDKIYDSTFVPGPILSSISGIIGMENVTISRYIAIYNKNTVGLNLIDISNITLRGPTQSNYRILPVAAINGFIDYKRLNTRFIAFNKFYDSYRNAIVFGTLSGIIGDERITISSVISMFKYHNVGTYLVDISSIELAGLTYQNYLVNPIQPVFASIFKRPLTATFRGGIKNYDKTFSTGPVEYTLSGMVVGEPIVISYYETRFKRLTAGNQIIDISFVILSGPLDNDNYDIGNNYYNLSVLSISSFIIPKPVGPIFTGTTKAYDGTTNVSTEFTPILQGVLPFDEVRFNYVFARYKSPDSGPQFIDVSNIFLTGLNSFNYVIIPIGPIDGVINFRGLTVLFSGGNKIYDGTRGVPELSYQFIGLNEGEIVTISSYIALFRNENIGNQTIDISNVIYGGSFTNYNINNILPINAVISQKQLQLLFTGGHKIYNRTLIPGIINFSISGVVLNESINLVSYASNFRNFNVGIRALDIFNILLSGSTINNYRYITSTTISATIFKSVAQLYFTAENKIYDGTLTTPTLNNYFVGLYSGDSLDVNYYVASYRNKNAGLNSILISTAFVVGISINNYDISLNDTISAYILPKNITASFSGGNKVYNKTQNTGPMSSVLLNVVPNDNVSISSFISRYRNFNFGINVIDISNVVLTGSDFNNYILNPVLPIMGFISRAPLYPLFTSDNKIYDGTRITNNVIGTLSGVFSDDNIVINSFNSIYNRSQIGLNRIDVSNIVITGDINNYFLTSAIPIYSNILPRDLTINFTDRSKIYDRNNIINTLYYTISNIVIGEQITISSYLGQLRNIFVGQTILDISNIILSGPTINNYIINLIPGLSAFIDRRPVYILFRNTNKIYDATQNIRDVSGFLYNIIPFDNIRLTSFTGLYKTQNIGLTFIDISNVVLSGTDVFNYILNPLQSISGNIFSRPIDTLFYGGDKDYDGNTIPGIIGFELFNTINSDNVTVISFDSVFRNPNVGVQIIDISNLLLFNASNYNILPIRPINAIISPKLVNINFTGLNKTYDNTDIAYVSNPIINGLVQPNNVSISSYISKYNNKFVENNKLIYVTNIVLTGFNSNNYRTPNLITLSSSILPKQIYLISTGDSKIYDRTISASISNISLSGIYIEDNITVGSYNSNYNDFNVQYNKIIYITNITLSGILSYNYFINPTTTIGNILRKLITVNFTGTTKNYDGTTYIPVINPIINDIIYPDTLTINSLNSNFINPNVGINKTIIVSDISFGGFSANNYMTGNSFTTGTITNPTSINVNLSSNNVVYKDISNFINVFVDPLWEVIDLNTNEELVGIFFNNVITKYGKMYNVQRNNTNIIYSSNYIFNNIVMSDISYGLICCNSGFIIQTNNFNVIKVGDFNIKSISRILNRNAYLVGTNGNIYKTINSGLNWYSQTSGINFDINDIAIIDNNNALAVSNSGILLRTTNGGINWTTRNLSNNNLNSIAMFDLYNGYIVGDDGLILRTNDGANWIICRDISNNSSFNHVYILNTNEALVVGNNGSILRTYNRGLNWYIYVSGTINRLNRIYNTSVVGTDGLYLNLINNPPGRIELYNNNPIPNNLISFYDISENNPSIRIGLSQFLVNVYFLYSKFVPANLSSYGVATSDIKTLQIRPIVIYSNTTTDVFYERSVVFSGIPFVDQSGGVFTIVDVNSILVQSGLVSINNIGVITFNTNIDVNTYLFNVLYSLNNTTSTVSYRLIIRPTFYYVVNTDFIVFGNNYISATPYVNQPRGTFSLNTTIPGITINSLSGNIIFVNTTISSYIINASYRLNNVSSNTSFNLIVRPFINYPIGITNLRYQTTSSSELPIVSLSGGLFDVSSVLLNKVSINNRGIISFGNNIDVGYYNINVLYSFNRITNNFIYLLNAMPFFTYNESFRTIFYEHTIYDASSLPIVIPYGGYFTLSDVSGTIVNENRVSVDISSGLLVFNLINVGLYRFLVSYIYNSAYITFIYNLLVKPSVNYTVNFTVINFNNTINSSTPNISPGGGTFSIIELDNILVQLNLVYINFFTGVITFLSGITTGIYNFRVDYIINNIITSTNYALQVIPNLVYVPDTTNLLYDISGFSSLPVYSPNGGLFSISGNTRITINRNSGLITFRNNINVGIYNLPVYYFINNVYNNFIYKLNIFPIIRYTIPSTTIFYKQSANSILPFTNQINGTFNIVDNSNNRILLVPDFVSIDISGIINFAVNINVGIYNFIVYYSLNGLTSLTTYNLIVKPLINYPIGYSELIYDRNFDFFTEPAFVDQSGGSFNISDLSGNLVSTGNVSIDNRGIIKINQLIGIATFRFNILYTLFNSFNNTSYQILVRPNVYYTISSYINNYNNPYSTSSPYYILTGGNFSISSSINATINQFGIITFNTLTNVGIYRLFITYIFNNISNNTFINYTVVPNITYNVNKRTLLFDVSGFSIAPTYSQTGGNFSINSNLVSINNIGIIYFPAGLNVGIYNFIITYSLNQTSSSTNYELNVLPTLDYIDKNNILLYERNQITYSLPPIYQQKNGIFTITDNLGNLVSNNLISIDNSGIIIIQQNINVGLYSFIVRYSLNNLFNTVIYNLTILPIFYYAPNITTINYSNGTTSVIPYYNQQNGIFTIIDVIGNLVGNSSIYLDANTGIIYFSNYINVGYYKFLVTYTLNGVFSTSDYELYVIPNINYSVGFRNLSYNTTGISVIPIVSQTKGTFSIFDLSGNTNNRAIINSSTGLITFQTGINVGIYSLNVIYTLNSVSNNFIYRLSIFPTITYDNIYQTILFYHPNIEKSSIPNVQQPNGIFNLLDISGELVNNNYAYIDSSGIIYFTNNINVGFYRLLVSYTLNSLSVNTLYYINIIPNLQYEPSSQIILYGTNVDSGIPYYDQSGGSFSFFDISGQLINQNLVYYDTSNGRFSFINIPDVGLYNIGIQYNLNGTFNSTQYSIYVLPIIIYDISSSTVIYNTNTRSIKPFVEQKNGFFTINGPNGVFIDSSNGEIIFTSDTMVDRYLLTITYSLNNVINNFIYRLTVLPIIDYNFRTVQAEYNTTTSSAPAINDPPDGLISFDSSSELIVIDPSNGIITGYAALPVGLYPFRVYYLYNKVINSVPFSFIMKPYANYTPAYAIVPYRDISFSVAPEKLPAGGIFSASVPYINLLYTGISINKDTGIIRFGIINSGYWNITVKYTVNGVNKNVTYLLQVLADIYYTPPYSVIPFNTTISTDPPFAKVPGGEYSSTAIINGFSINSTTGVLTFTNVYAGVYYIPITYTIFGNEIVVNYTLLVKPIVIYIPDTYNAYYTQTISSALPFLDPIDGVFSATFNDDNNTPLLPSITIDISSGRIRTDNTLRVGHYELAVSYTSNGSTNEIPFTINIYPNFDYLIGFLQVIYGSYYYTEQPKTNPQRGEFTTTNNKFYVNPVNGILEINDLINVGRYSVPISYTSNNMTVTRYYNIVVNPLYTYTTNNIELVYGTGGQSELPIALEPLGTFFYVSICGTIPYITSFIQGQSLINGIVLNGFTGLLTFGNRINVGRYDFIFKYLLYDLSSNTTYSLLVRPYVNYTISNIILDYNTSAVSTRPIVDQSGGFFTFQSLTSEFSKIIINNNTGIINFAKGINVGSYDIVVKYEVRTIPNLASLKLTVKPIFYYQNNITTITINQSSNSSLPIAILSGGFFEIINYNGLNLFDLFIDSTTGILYFNPNFLYDIPIGIYNLTIRYTLNNSSTNTNYQLIVRPFINYENGITVILYSNSGYSEEPTTITQGGLFTFEDITDLGFQSSKVDIDASSGIIYFNNFININDYNLIIGYLYNNVKNTFTYKLKITPYFIYSISGKLLEYQHSPFTSVIPNVNPTKGVFAFTDFSRNYPLDIQVSSTLGSLTINRVPVGNYNIGIRYYVKTFVTNGRYILSIIPTFNYPKNLTIMTYNDISYSNLPYVDPSGGNFNFVYPINPDLFNKMNINNSTGLISFNNDINVNNYEFYLSYSIRNIESRAIYYLTIKPLFYYNENTKSVLYKRGGYSSLPIVLPEGGIFSVNYYYGINIDISTGLISISSVVLPEIYNLQILYTYNNISSLFNYQVLVNSNLYYDPSNSIVIYGNSSRSVLPYKDSNGIFSIPNGFNLLGITINSISGNLLFNNIIPVDNYNIPITYIYEDIQQNVIYNLLVKPYLLYDISNIIINYEQTYRSKKALINPINGIFSANVVSVDTSGIISINNINVNNYDIFISYTVNNIASSYYFNLIIKPVFYYTIKNQKIIYGINTYSSVPYTNPQNGQFSLDLSNIPIYNNGQIEFNKFNIGRFFINVYYSYNNIVSTDIYSYYIIPFINYDENKIIYGGNSSNSIIPEVNPLGGVFSCNNLINGVIINNNGQIDFSNNLYIGIYNFNINYRFNDISNTFIYKLTVLPFINYNDGYYNYREVSFSETPFSNFKGGLYTINFDPQSTITIASIHIDPSSGIIRIDSNLNVSYYYFYVNYLLNKLSYTHTYNLYIRPVFNYDDIILEHHDSYSAIPVLINPVGGIFTSNNLPYFVSLTTTGTINIDDALEIGYFVFDITYTFNNITQTKQTTLIIKPVIYYEYILDIIYGSIGYSDNPIISISGGVFYALNIPSGVTLNSSTGVFYYNSTVNVNSYTIPVYYIYNDISNNTDFELIVRSSFNYVAGEILDYGTNDISVIPTVSPTGGEFSILNMTDKVIISSLYGILEFSSTISVGTYIIEVIYTYNNVISSFNYNLQIVPKYITASFVADEKIYNGNTNVKIRSNKLVGVINNDQTYVETYNAYVLSPDPGINVPVYVDNIVLGGKDKNNYITQFANNTNVNIILSKYTPNYVTINRGTIGNSNSPILSSNFINPSFLIINPTPGVSINPYGVIIWDDTLDVGIYNLEIRVYNFEESIIINFTLEVTVNLYSKPIEVQPPISDTFSIEAFTYDLQYTTTDGVAYVVSDIPGLVGKFSITAYSNDNITHDLNDTYEFTFNLPNADPSGSLVMYELNDDGTVNYTVPYNIFYKGGTLWATYLRYLSDFIAQDLIAVPISPPTASPEPGFYFTSVRVELSGTPNCLIYYTLDGSTPTLASTLYTQAINLIQPTTIKAFAASPGFLNSSIVSFEYIVSEVPCILSKTLIKVPSGYNYIDNLKAGDYVVTDDNRIVPILKITKYKIDNPQERHYPICIPKNFFNVNVPERDTYISENHAIRVNNYWIYGQQHLSYFNKIRIKPEYYHIMLPNYFTDNLVANNLPIESWSGFAPKNAYVTYINYNTETINNKEYKLLKKVKFLPLK